MVVESPCSTARFIRTPKTEAGCRILINILLLRAVSVMCPGEMTVNIIMIPSPSNDLQADSGKYSFSGVVDFLVTKLPARYTVSYFSVMCWSEFELLLRIPPR